MWLTVTIFPLDKNIQTLVDYLNINQVAHRVVEINGQQALQVVSEQQKAQTLTYIQQWQSPNFEAVKPVVDLPINTNTQLSFSMLKRTPITGLLVALSVLGYLIYTFEVLRQALSFVSFYKLTLASGYVYLPSQKALPLDEIWRLLTPAFLHLGLFHVVFNGLWVWDFGRRIEMAIGFKHYLLFFIITAIASNVSQHYWSDVPRLFGGMSGVIYAMVGYIAFCQKFDVTSKFNVPTAILAFMLGWLLLCLSGVVDLFMSGGIANGAHVGGLVAGIIFAAVKVSFNNRTHPKI